MPKKTYIDNTVLPTLMPRAEAESSITAINNSIATKASQSAVTTLSNDVTSLKTWRAAKAGAIADVTSTPTAAMGINVAGITVASTAGVSELRTFYTELRDKVNSILAALRNREIIS